MMVFIDRLSTPVFRRVSIFLLGLSALLLALQPLEAAGSTRDRPNIVLILADDLGWSDLGCYGSTLHQTPNLDRLAREGVRFSHGYAPAPICSASRAAILTGRSPARLQFEFVTKNAAGRQSWDTPLQSPDYTLDLPLTERTIGEVLRDAGYATGYYGKWHVSRHAGAYLHWSKTHGPLQQGFMEGDQEFGSHPYGYRGDAGRTFGDHPPGDFGPDALTDRAIDFLRRHRERPFFLYLSHYYVHTPVHTRLQWLHERHRRAGLSDARAAFAAMVETLDHLVGRVLGALDELGLAERTLVVFTSDNGGHPEYSANAPLRGSKWNLYEGGIRVPFLARWPGRIRSGTVSDEPVIGTDLFPTFAEAAGAALPPGVPLDGRSLRSAWSAGPGAKPRPERALVWHFPYYHPEGEKLFGAARREIGVNDFAVSQTRPHSAIRAGDFKLLKFAEGGRTELYQVSKDIGEQQDLAGHQPERARALQAQLEESLASVRARRARPRTAETSP